MQTLSLGILYRGSDEAGYEIRVRHPYTTGGYQCTFKAGREENRIFIKWAKKNLKHLEQGFEDRTMQSADWKAAKKYPVYKRGWPSRSFKLYRPARNDRFYCIKNATKSDLVLTKLAWQLQKWVD